MNNPGVMHLPIGTPNRTGIFGSTGQFAIFPHFPQAVNFTTDRVRFSQASGTCLPAVCLNRFLAREGKPVAKAKKATSTRKSTRPARGASSKSTATARKPATAKKSAAAKRPAVAKRAAADKKKDKGKDVVIDRRSTKDRRDHTDRRKKSKPVVVERRKLERRVKVNRRRQIDPTTCERDYTVEEIEFMSALDDYKRSSGRMFPTCSEVLEVLRKLGYEKRPPIEPETSPSPPDAEAESPSVHPPEQSMPLAVDLSLQPSLEQTPA